MIGMFTSARKLVKSEMGAYLLFIYLFIFTFWGSTACVVFVKGHVMDPYTFSQGYSS